MLTRIARRLWYLLNRRRFERDLEREMAAHRAMMDDPRRFGSAVRLREQSADAWGWTWIDDLRQDLRYAVRQLVGAPRLAVGAVCILALGAGTPLAFLHLANGVGHYMYAVPDSSRLVRVSRQRPNIGTRLPIAAASFYREHATAFSFLVAENRGWRVSLDEDPGPLHAAFVSPNYFQALKVTAERGRLLDARDSGASSPPVVVLGHAYWQRRFEGTTGVVDDVVRVNGVAVRIVGVTPRDFDGLARPGTASVAVWFPAAVRPQIIESSPALDDVTRADTEVYGALADGVSTAAAVSQLETLTKELQRRHGGVVAIEGAPTVVPLMDGLRLEADVAVLFALFLLIFFSACANLGNLLLARALGRSREIDLRLALGASRWRILRQLLTESAALAILGCAGGALAGLAGARMILRLVDDMPPGLHVALDWRMLIASCGLVFLAVVGFGLTPALHAVRRGRTSTRARQTLVAVQVAASCVLLIVATLLARSGERSRPVDPALDYSRTIVLDPQLGSRVLTPSARRAIMDDAAARVARLPGVDAVSLAVPTRFTMGQPGLLFQEVSPSYFAALRLPLLRGRTFVEGEQNALIVSETAARALWPGQEPLGQTWTAGRGRVSIVVGIVADSGLSGNPPAREAYVPLADAALSRTALFAHTVGDPRALLRDARGAAVPAGVTPTAMMMADAMDAQERRQGGMARMLAGLGTLATLLAFSGILTLVAFAVAQRTREIGVRMALGARRSDVLGTLLRQYTTPLLGGAAIGVALAIGAAQVLRTQLHGVTPLDPISHLTGLIGFAVVALFAILLPARRALRIQPADALRWE